MTFVQTYWRLDMKFNSIILILCVLIIISGCGQYKEHDRQPDDDFTQAVKDEFDDAFLYYDKQEINTNILRYEFLIKTEDKEDLDDFVRLLNEQLCNQETKIEVVLLTRFTYGAVAAFSLKNFSDRTLQHPDYANFSCLHISYITEEHSSFWDDYTIYYTFPNIERLEISNHLREISETDGIDWYEIWPDLEEVIVYDT